MDISRLRADLDDLFLEGLPRLVEDAYGTYAFTLDKPLAGTDATVATINVSKRGIAYDPSAHSPFAGDKQGCSFHTMTQVLARRVSRTPVTLLVTDETGGTGTWVLTMRDGLLDVTSQGATPPIYTRLSMVDGTEVAMGLVSALKDYLDDGQSASVALKAADAPPEVFTVHREGDVVSFDDGEGFTTLMSGWFLVASTYPYLCSVELSDSNGIRGTWRAKHKWLFSAEGTPVPIPDGLREHLLEHLEDGEDLSLWEPVTDEQAEWLSELPPPELILAAEVDGHWVSTAIVRGRNGILVELSPVLDAMMTRAQIVSVQYLRGERVCEDAYNVLSGVPIKLS